ncbi:MAG: GGDEF domain-containing protein [Rhodanobacter sp.]
MLPPLLAQTATAPDPAAFDHLLKQLNDGTVSPDSDAAVKNTLAQLHALLPPHDAAREFSYEYIYCFLAFQSDAKGGVAFARRGVERARQAGDLNAESNFQMCLGNYLIQASGNHDALQSFDAAVLTARRLGDTRVIADALTWRGNQLSLLGDQAKAMIDLLDAQTDYEKIGNAPAPARANLVNIASLYRRMGEYDDAADYLRQAMAAIGDAEDKQQLLAIYMGQGFLASERGRPADAVAPQQKALDLAREIGPPQNVGAALLAQAESSNQLGQYEKALRQLAEAAKVFQSVSDNSNADMLALQTAEAHAGLGQHALAAQEFQVAATALANSGNLRYLAELYAARSKNEEALGRPQAALDDLRRMVATNKELEQKTKAQVTTLMRYRFDTARRDLENRRLADEKALQSQQLASLESVRTWQQLAILLGGVLMIGVTWLGYRQLLKSRRLNRLSLVDPLTGISNRRHIDHLLDVAVANAGRTHGELTVAMLDIDHFKHVNDSHGHPAGDQVLRETARICQDSMRQHDRFGRFGGEEFLVVLPDTDLEHGLMVAERLRAKVADAVFVVGDAKIKITVSLGVSALRANEAVAGTLVQRADSALYRAKQAGRNRVESI